MEAACATRKKQLLEEYKVAPTIFHNELARLHHLKQHNCLIRLSINKRQT